MTLSRLLVNASPSLPLSNQVPKYSDETDFEVFTPLPFPAKTNARKSSHRLWPLYRVSPIQHRKLYVFDQRERQATTSNPLLSRFFPLQRFTSHGEPHNPASSTLIRLSCVLRVLHPLDALLPW